MSQITFKNNLFDFDNSQIRVDLNGDAVNRRDCANMTSGIIGELLRVESLIKSGDPKAATYNIEWLIKGLLKQLRHITDLHELEKLRDGKVI